MPDVSHREFTERVCNLPAQQIRELCEDNFILAANVLTRNWIEGNPRSEWDGKPFRWEPVASKTGKHHFEDWYDRIRRNAANMFLAARKHTKTTFADTLMIWKSEYVPGHQSLYWANTRKQVKDRMEELEEIAAANPWLANVSDEGALLSKTFENGAGITTTWVTGGYEGGHVDLQLGDDPMKELGDISDSEVEHWYGNVIVPTLNPGDTLQAIIGTRKRPNDLYEILRRRHEEEGFADHIPGYNLVEYPAIREAWQQEYDRPGDLAPKGIYTTVHAPDLADALDLETDVLHFLWPAARDESFYLRNLGMQGRKYFLREFCMVYTEVEDAVVHREWIRATSHPQRPPARFADPWQPADYPDPVTREDFDRVVVGHDPAGKGRDRFAFVTVGVLTHPPEALPTSMQRLAIDDAGNPRPVQLRHILDAWQAQDVPPSRWREKLTALHDRYSPDAIAIESNLNQTWAMDDDQIPQRVRHAITGMSTGRGKHSWTDGVPAIGSDIEAGQYRFYTGGDDNQTDELANALTTVRREDGELVGHTPDMVMALYMAHKELSKAHVGSSRRSLTGGSSEKARERERRSRDTRAELRGSEVGDAILSTLQDRQRF